MAWLGDSVTNATLRLVRGIETKYEQSEQMATIAVGITVGVVISVCIMACLCVSAKVCSSMRRRTSMKEVCCTEEEPVSPQYDTDGGVPAAQDCHSLDTEGAYRSDSDADDEGHGQRLAKDAQRRARGEGQV